MDRLHHLINVLSLHWIDPLFALVFAILVDFLGVGSFLREVLRKFKNYLSQQSVAPLRERIVELERYRDSLSSYVYSDKTHYMATLRYIIVVLICLCTAIFVLVLDQLGLAASELSRGYAVLALVPLAMGIVLGVLGARVASFDTALKISETIAELDAEIAALKSKLNALTGESFK